MYTMHNVSNSLLPLLSICFQTWVWFKVMLSFERCHNFWCILSVSSEFFKHVQNIPKSWETVCLTTIFHQKPDKTLLRAWKPLKIASSHLFFQTCRAHSLGWRWYMELWSEKGSPTTTLSINKSTLVVKTRSSMFWSLVGSSTTCKTLSWIIYVQE